MGNTGNRSEGQNDDERAARSIVAAAEASGRKSCCGCAVVVKVVFFVGCRGRVLWCKRLAGGAVTIPAESDACCRLRDAPENCGKKRGRNDRRQLKCSKTRGGWSSEELERRRTHHLQRKGLGRRNLERGRSVHGWVATLTLRTSCSQKMATQRRTSPLQRASRGRWGPKGYLPLHGFILHPCGFIIANLHHRPNHADALSSTSAAPMVAVYSRSPYLRGEANCPTDLPPLHIGSDSDMISLSSTRTHDRKAWPLIQEVLNGTCSKSPDINPAFPPSPLLRVAKSTRHSSILAGTSHISPKTSEYAENNTKMHVSSS
jgi:hypothetical protein